VPGEDWAKLHAAARRHLSRRDPVMKELIAAVGSCTLAPGGDPFALLVRAIVAQLISTKAAATISARVVAAAGDEGVCPAAMLRLGEAGLRPLGLSGAKAQAILDLASRASDGRLPLGRLAGMTDEEIAASLTAVRGIGVWTAEMFLIFGLGRPDVLPVGDLGLRAGVQDRYGLEELPGALRLREIAEPWRPYRSIATWYLWRSRGGVPQSK
jgi:DNA-3-methyladenine glycosylase II